MTPLATTRTTIQQVATTIALANGLAASGRAVDLAGLDQLAGRLCARILDLPPAEGQAVRPALVALQQSLEALARTMQPPTQ